MSRWPTAVAYDDVDAIYLDPGLDREGELFQLEAGPLGLRGELTALPGVHIYEWTYGAAMMGYERRNDDTLRVFFRLDAGAPRQINGREVHAHVGTARLGDQHVEWISPPGLRLLELDIAPYLVDTFDWHHLAGGEVFVLPADPDAASRLVYIAGLISTFVRANPHLPEDRLLALRDRVLLALRSYLAAGPDDEATRSVVARAGRVFRLGNEYLENRPLEERLSVAAMAADVGVAERTLYGAFQDWVGMGPYELDLVRRMHVFRTDLIRRSPGRGRVLESARYAGFSDHSRLGQQYKRHFGESPSLTARRWDDEAGGARPEARRTGTA